MADEMKKTYNRGDTVEQEGDYVCVPCGYKKHFKPGGHFTECMSCLAGTKDGHEDFVEGLELWEHASAGTPETPSEGRGSQ